jgi:hypothetical protein
MTEGDKNDVESNTCFCSLFRRLEGRSAIIRKSILRHGGTATRGSSEAELAAATANSNLT